MTQIHEQLYRSESLSHIDMSHYVAGLAEELRYVYTKGDVVVLVDVQQVRLTIDQGIPCGLIINELVTNSLKYAFPAQASRRWEQKSRSKSASYRGIVCVLMHAVGDQCLMQVSDNGVGLPEGLDLQNMKTLGLRLVSRLVDQLGGKLVVKSDPHNPVSGASFEIVFTINK